MKQYQSDYSAVIETKEGKMEENASMQHALDEEAEISPNMEKYKDVMATYFGEPVKRDICEVGGNEESGSQKEPDPKAFRISEIMKNICEKFKCIKGKYVIPLQPIEPELIKKYQNSFKNGR